MMVIYLSATSSSGDLMMGKSEQ